MTAQWIKVDKGVPIPPRRQGGTGNIKSRARIPWKDMAIGDSVFLAGCSPERARLKLFTPRSLYGYGFSIREVDAGSRIWRTK